MVACGSSWSVALAVVVDILIYIVSKFIVMFKSVVLLIKCRAG